MPGAWEKDELIIIGVPIAGPVTIDWVCSLIALRKPPNTRLISWRGVPVDVARNRIVKDALRQGANYLFFLDSDVHPPENALIRLINWRLPIVSGLYYSKRGYPGVWRLLPDGKFTPTPVQENSLMEVDGVPAGCLLVDMEVFRKVPFPWFRWTSEDPESEEGLSEDLFFCKKVREMGFKIFCDTTVKCYHEVLVKADPYWKKGE